VTCVTRKEVERSEPFEKGLDLKSVWGHQFFHKYPFNILICKQLLLTDDVGVYSMVYKQCEYLWLKGGFYYFRRHVPETT